MKTFIIAFAIIFSGMLIHAQVSTEYIQDTLWLKSGKTIPCKITSIDSVNNQITLKYYYANGILIYETMAFELIEAYSIGSEINPYKIIAEEKKPLLPDSIKSVKAYFGFGFGFPSGGLSFTVILKNDWGGSLSYKHTSYDKRDNSGQTSEFSLCVVKEFPVKTTKRVRGGLEAGPSLVKYEKVEQIRLVSGWLGSYYEKQTSKHTTMGLNLRAKLEFPLTLAFGFEIALYSNINKYKSVIGFEFYLTLGKVRDRIKPRKHKN
jgi:hypothetical protein